MKRKTIASVGAGVLAAAALTLGAVAPANADPTRSPCTPDYLQLFSPVTSCWANAGDAYPTLYQVTGLSSGNNAGYINGGIYARFGKYATSGWPGSYTITHIHIN